MIPTFWPEFGILFLAALIGGAAILPYAFKLLNAKGQESRRKLSTPALVAISFAQTAVVAALTIGLGLLAAHRIGLGAPYIEGILSGYGAAGIGNMAYLAAVSGAVAGFFLLLADLVFLPYWPKALLEATRRTSTLDNFLASLYGGINEEFFMRLFGMSVLAWLFAFISHTAAGYPTSTALWAANVIMTILFGLGHLPALKNILGGYPPLMVVRSLLLNAPIGLLCGWLFWMYGIEAAVIAHFSADIIYHVFGTVVLNQMRKTSAA